MALNVSFSLDVTVLAVGFDSIVFLFKDHCIDGVKRCDCMMIMTLSFLYLIFLSLLLHGSWSCLDLSGVGVLCSGVLRDQFVNGLKYCLVVALGAFV